MKRLEEALEIGPKYTEEFKQANLRTVRDLANVKNLQKLSDDTRIPIELIRDWHAQAKRKVQASRYMRRVSGVLAIVALTVFGLFFRHAYGSRATAQPGAQAESQGEELYNKGNYAAALVQFEKAIQLDPQNNLAYANRGAALRRVGRPQESVASLDKAIELNSSDAWAWDQRGTAYTDLGQYPRALQDFDKAIQLDPKYSFAYADKAFALRKLGPTQEAVAAIDKTVELDPQQAWAYNERGIIYHDDLHQYQEAYQDAKKAADLAPNNLDYRLNLAEAALTAGRLPEAYDLAGKILADNKNRDVKDFDPSDRLIMRFVMISALLLQNRVSQANAELQDFITYSMSVGPDFMRHWDFSGTQNFIQGRTLDAPSKNMILELIQFLQQPPKSTIDRIVSLRASLRANNGAD